MMAPKLTLCPVVGDMKRPTVLRAEPGVPQLRDFGGFDLVSDTAFACNGRPFDNCGSRLFDSGRASLGRCGKLTREFGHAVVSVSHDLNRSA
jgi:hypothetical protein